MSNFGKALRTAGIMYIPKVIGEAYGGGYFCGRLRVGGVGYALVAAPVSGETSSTFSTAASDVPAGLSDWDGNANMAILKAAGLSTHPAAQFCAGLTIGGYTDWVLPAKAMLEVMYRNLKTYPDANVTDNGANAYSDPVGSNYTTSVPAQTSVANFKVGGADVFQGNFYCSSSPALTTTVYVHNMLQGASGAGATNSTRFVRAMRMVRMPD